MRLLSRLVSLLILDSLFGFVFILGPPLLLSILDRFQKLKMPSIVLRHIYISQAYFFGIARVVLPLLLPLLLYIDHVFGISCKFVELLGPASEEGMLYYDHD